MSVHSSAAAVSRSVFPCVAPATARQADFDGAVVLSPFFWNFRDDMWQTTHHVARQLAARIPTLFVEPPVQWNPHSAEFRWHRLAANLFAPRLRAADERLNVLGRRSLPLGRLGAIEGVETRATAGALRRMVRQLGWRRILLWHSFPYNSLPLLDAIESDFHAYHCLDYSPREEERTLVARADAVFCVSPTLVEKYRAQGRAVCLLPNGVDLSLFDPERAALEPRPRDLPSSGRIIGFLGYVNYHVDLELVASVARAFSRDTVVLVGRVPTGHTAPQGAQLGALESLRALPNVRILGFRPTEQLPAYLHAFDACLIPFLRNRFNAECDPLKFYQYLAMGKPIVSTPVAVASAHPRVCRVARTRQEFLEAVAESLSRPEDSPEREARRDVARAHGWPALVDAAWRTIDERRNDRLLAEVAEWT